MLGFSHEHMGRLVMKSDTTSRGNWNHKAEPYEMEGIFMLCQDYYHFYHIELKMFPLCGQVGI